MFLDFPGVVGPVNLHIASHLDCKEVSGLVAKKRTGTAQMKITRDDIKKTKETRHLQDSSFSLF